MLTRKSWISSGAGLLGRAVNLKRQRRQQAIHLLDGVIVDARAGCSRFHPGQRERSLIGLAKRVGHALHGPNLQVGIGLRFQRQRNRTVAKLNLQVRHALLVAAIQTVGDAQQGRQQRNGAPGVGIERFGRGNAGGWA